MTVIGIGLLPTVCKQTEALRRSVQEESEQRVRERAEEPSKTAAAVLQPEVAERKRTEEALHESEERCQNLFKNAVDAIMTFTPDGTITSVNHRLEMTLGWSREELISCHYSKLVTPASVAAVEERIRQFLAGERSASIFAADLVRKDRSVVPVEAHICPIRDQAGALIEILGIYQDLTERKRAEEESRRSIAELAEWRNRYEAAIQATGQVLYDWNSQTDEVIWGGAVKQMLGYTLGELPGTLAAAMALIHSEDRAIFVQEIERVRAIKTALQLEYRLRRKDGAYITVENKGHFFVDRTGVPVRMVGFLADITEHQQRAKALRKSEEQLRAQYRGIPIPTYTWQRVGDDFVLIDYNDAAHAITRGRIGELIGVKASECHRNAPGSRAEFLRCWREKTIIKREMQWRFSDGEIKYFAVSYAFVPPDLVLVHTEDITERKRAEAALQQSEERFSKAFHASPDPITISTLADGRFLDVNARFLEMLGYQREEVIGHSALELGLWTNPADHASVTAVLHDQGSIRNREATFRTKAGERREILLAVELMTLNGEPCVLALIHDITARKQMDIALRESEERYRALFENANDAIATATLEGIFTQVNRAAECLLGLSREEVIGQPVQKFLTPTSAAYKADRIRRALAGEQLSATFELEVVNKNGKVIPVEARARLIRNPEGHPIGYQGIYRDITERKALEQQRADFLAMLSHDIRNPLGIILGYAEMLLEEEAVQKVAGAVDLLERILSNALTVHSLVTNYLDLTRIEAGQLILAKHPLQLNDLLLRVGRQYETEARRRRIRLECQLQLDLPPIEADAVALERVFANLLHNALKFTPQGGQVTIRSTLAEGEVVAAIADTGPGIRTEDIPLLFEKYKRADQEESPSGTGLGLFIVRSVVTAHGGRVTVDSAPGVGTCFSVLLPMETPEGKPG